MDDKKKDPPSLIEQEGCAPAPLEEDLPIVHYFMQMVPHVVIDPCPGCGAGVELQGTAQPGMQTPMDPYIMRAAAGKTFRMKCPECGLVYQVEKPLIEIAGGNRHQRRAAAAQGLKRT